MGLSESDFEELLAHPDPVLADWTDRIVPAAVEPLAHNRYTPAYAWMYAYEKRLKYRVEKALERPLGRHREKVIFGGDGVLSEALSNAFAHGHRREATKPLEIRTVVRRSSLAFSILDQGPGFDHRLVVREATRGGGFFHFAGNGVRTLLAQPAVTFSWADGGRRLNLLIDLAAGERPARALPRGSLP